MSKPWVSLKWKAVLLPSLLLCLIFLLSSLILAQRLEHAFDATRNEAAARYEREVRSLLGDSAIRLQEIAELLPHMAGIQQALTTADKDALNHAFDTHWPGLQLAHSVEIALLFDDQDDLLLNRSSAEPLGAVLSEAHSWAAAVNRSERPRIELRCPDHCFQFASIPILLSGEHLGVLTLGRSLGESIIGLQESVGKHVGLLIAEPDGLEPDSGPAILRPWRMRVDAIGDAPTNLAMLRSVAQSHPRPTLEREPLRFQWDSRLLELHFFSLTAPSASARSDNVNQNEHFLVVIDDITVDAGTMRNTVRILLMVAMLGLVLGVGTLLLILLRPTDRLKRMAQLLPLLPQQRYTQVRDALVKTKPGMVEDEIDVLEATALQVTDNLERMSGEIDLQQRELLRRMDEIEVERDFSTRLLDTAEVIILTLDADTRIITANRHALKVTEYSTQELRGRPFSNLFLAGYTSQALHSTLQPVLSGQRQLIRHEATLTTKSGSRRDIVWLHSAIRGRGAALLSVGLDVTENLRATESLNWLAAHDPLTGLLNRRRFEEQTDRFLSLLGSNPDHPDHKAALLVLDIDHFRDINEVGGPQTGDRLLRLVAEHIQDFLGQDYPGQPLCARLGGDEFGLLLADTLGRDPRSDAQRLIERLKALNLTADNKAFKVSASIGIALIPEHGAEVSELMAHADAAKIRAKQTGKGLAQVYAQDQSGQPQAHQRLYWRDRIDRALSEDGFRLYYQPLLDIRSRQIHHYEVLIRMLDEDGSIIPPNHFIPIAERSGQIFRIDRFVLEHAVAAQGRYARQGTNIGLSINLSAHAFDDDGLPDLLADKIHEYGADPSRLMFELTETAALSDIKAANQLMNRIRALGCLFALDDFGVGFTSFSYLRELPVDIVKIDGAFVRDLPSDASNQTVVRALVDVARGFGKRTIAEFVDSEETLLLLESFGVDTAQGYHIGKPQPEIARGQNSNPKDGSP
ncbi:Cyclic di-GMP phosphodiesterase Gmr [Thiorhodovibrio winogradskyi]|uniref:Cyclic di-GMP phosphodiesterase Gmr n=1 Tax=Thiorhodovibrio winogradskyi TaxID=77007 RepID=A0ABZ0S5W1_9GAMM|nr:EAL domain-containing protein [Thiorhodovibrio winogradskyi]